MDTADHIYFVLCQIFQTCYTFNEGCGGTMIMRSGTITSPGFPKEYPPGIICQWNITTQTHDIIELRFQDFHLENHANCSHDYVAVYDGFDSNKQLMGKYCGNTSINLPWSKTENMQIEFKADHSNHYRGFSATFTGRGCGGTLTKSIGLITSPGYPDNYPNGVRCQWNLTAQKNVEIELRFNELIMEVCSDCSCDSVSVFTGNNLNQVLIGKFCSNNVSSTFFSKGKMMQLLFVTDGSATAKGFSATFTKACSSGSYGPDCNFTCNQNCLKISNRSSCSNRDGQCLYGCTAGFQGARCDYVCSTETYGPRCESECSPLCARPSSNRSSCHHVSGDCLHGCQDGFMGLKCDTRCVTNTYGPSCKYDCSSWCERATSNGSICSHINGSCLHGCQDGYHGLKCETSCGGTLTKSFGFITSPGYPGDYPNSVRCQWNLPALENEEIELSFSDFDLQDCSSCACDSVSVYTGNIFNQSLIGKFCSNNISRYLISTGKTKQLVFVTNENTTFKGFNATFSKACSSGLYGPDCNFTCSQNCIKSSNRTSCHHVDGRCLDGCTAGFQGDTCENVSSETPIITTVTTVVCVLLATALVLLLVIVYLRRKSQRTEVHTEQEMRLNVAYTKEADQAQPYKEMSSSATPISGIKGTHVKKRAIEDKTNSSHDKFYDSPDNPESSPENEYTTIGDVK